MKVLLVSWEHPPVVIGGLGRHVGELAAALAAGGHDVTVLCRRPTGTDATTHPDTDVRRDGVRVVAAAEDPHAFTFSDDMMAWVLAMGHAMLRAGLAATAADPPQVVHAHDWLVAHPAIALADHLGVPLVSTVHATEAGRHGGWLSAPVNRQVHACESWLARRSDALITCSASMRAEVGALHGDPGPAGIAPVTVIGNGIDVTRWPYAPRAPRPGPARLLFVGRLEYEKGVHHLLGALARVRRTHPGTTLTVAGDGTQRAWLLAQARRHRVLSAVDFAGELGHDALLAALHAADVVVLPSLYEPFGIAALEAAAAGAPLVVTDVGGLGEAVVHGVTGTLAAPGDVAALADAVRAVLDDPAAAQRRARAGRDRITTDRSWRTVADRTAQVYAAARRRARAPLGRLPIPDRALPQP